MRTSLAPLRNGLSRGILAAVVATTALFLLGTAAARADFHLVGDTLNVDGTRDAVDTSVADVGGVPYVAWRETTGILGGLIFVKRFDGTSWVPGGRFAQRRRHEGRRPSRASRAWAASRT